MSKTVRPARKTIAKPAQRSLWVDPPPAAASNKHDERLASRSATWWGTWLRVLAADEIGRRVDQVGELWPADAVVLHVGRIDAAAIRRAEAAAVELYGDEIAEIATRSPGEAVSVRTARIAQTLLDLEGWRGWAAAADAKTLAAIVAALDIDIRGEWSRACRGACAGRPIVRNWLELQTRKQLQALAAEWKVSPAGEKRLLIRNLLADVERPVPRILAAKFRQASAVNWRRVLRLEGVI